MISQPEATIFLADQRGRSEVDWFRSFHTFNFGEYRVEHRQPFGTLRVFNDDTLASQKSLSLQVEENMDVILLPLVGAIEYEDSLGEAGILEAGQVQILNAPEGFTYKITNPYSDELINFLQIWVKNQSDTFVPQSNNFTFDFRTKNQLNPLFATQAQGWIGRYDGRVQDTYPLLDEGHGVFVFVIEGAFEVQNRLLHPRDGLALSQVSEVEFEALSNNAIILIIELPM